MAVRERKAIASIADADRMETERKRCGETAHPELLPSTSPQPCVSFGSSEAQKGMHHQRDSNERAARKESLAMVEQKK